VVEGNITADSVTIEGYVKGNVRALTEVMLAPNGRVFGNVRSPSVKIAAGSLFDGKCIMEEERRPGSSQAAPA
jgi:cytoskeletal protein CcmA (bactofilin family)